ncbi:hypothetical protein SAMN05444336_10988 [Albimonas donghaensis]|uniref:Lipoprotein-attachment site-containing protein n=1 Tax=Albimonas donghaensis TaxID=356660 RepID=A0A1H3E6C5_9RHOB|nr:hypothetical protein [Albimonas donghaensis]SDX74231.1 hypothetical protein SAMN05444336_10988 [Albimonas donghaensis]
MTLFNAVSTRALGRILLPGVLLAALGAAACAPVAPPVSKDVAGSLAPQQIPAYPTGYGPKKY